MQNKNAHAGVFVLYVAGVRFKDTDIFFAWRTGKSQK